MRRHLLTLAFLISASFAAHSIRADDASPLGKTVRDFQLPDVTTGKDIRLSDFKDKIVVIIFYTDTCTFCRNYEERFRQLAADHVGKGVAVLAIDSTGRSAKEMAAAWREKTMGFPLLRDETARTAASLGATAMTTVCIVDDRRTLRYVGAFDDSESGKDVRCRFAAEAVAALLVGKSVPREQTEVYGCMIPLPQ